MRPRYKDFTLLAMLKGTHGKMSCQEIGWGWGMGCPMDAFQVTFEVLVTLGI